MLIYTIVNIYKASLEKKIKKKYVEEITMRKNFEKFWKKTIYVVLLIKKEWKLKEILRKFRKFLIKKELILNIKK